MEYTKPLARLIEFFQKFPGIGPKSAQRMAFHLLKMPLGEVQRFAEILVEAKQNIHYCSVCFNMSASNPCEICSDTRRDNSTICVVAETKDLIAIEKTREYKGLYHVLQGTLSPTLSLRPRTPAPRLPSSGEARSAPGTAGLCGAPAAWLS